MQSNFGKKYPLAKPTTKFIKFFKSNCLVFFLQKHPKRYFVDGFIFKIGKGENIIGPLSGQHLKLPFSDYVPLKKGAIGDPRKTYKIGYSIHGLDHPWLLNNADSAVWEANRHPNVHLTVLDPRFDDKKQIEHVNQWIEEGFDGILIWPRIEGPTAEVIHKAVNNGIKVVSIDRLTGSNLVTHRITGDLPANGAMQGIYLVHRLLEENGKVKGNIVMIRKPLGSSDAYRTGHFLKIISYFPGLRIIGNYHNNSNREMSREQIKEAIKRFKDIDVIFCTGAEQSMGVIEALNETQTWYGRKGNKRIIILSNDDSREAMKAVKDGKQAMLSPFTPLLGDLGMRVLLRSISGETLPQDITTPSLPMVTKEKNYVFGLQTVSVDEWMPYAYGPE